MHTIFYSIIKLDILIKYVIDPTNKPALIPTNNLGGFGCEHTLLNASNEIQHIEIDPAYSNDIKKLLDTSFDCFIKLNY